MLGSSEQKALTQKEVSTVIQGPDGISIISDYSIRAELRQRVLRRVFRYAC